ncbi:RING/U-box protein [Striga hermonthica]|uniref:RING/U-box protein n=1 Tax=Striga hermonthica TaxID=68872 RepID=A0A9N7NR72_STRHE|nr:RING/U-box protein [Striga hermonthica]
MARGGKIGYKRKTRNKVHLEKKGSDESDEDYRVDEGEDFDGSEDEYCSSLAEDDLEESLGEFEEEEEWVDKKVKKVERRSIRKGSETGKKNEVKNPRRKKAVYSEEEEEEDDDDEEDEDFYLDDDDDDEEEEKYVDYDSSCIKKRNKNKVSRKKEGADDIEFLNREEKDKLTDGKPMKKSRVSKIDVHTNSYIEDHGERDSYPDDMEDDDFDDSDDEDVDYNDSDDDDDEEFSPGEIAKRARRKSIKKRVPRRRKRRSKPIKASRGEKPASRKRKPIKGWVCRKRSKSKNKNSDSDFMSSGSSDYEYTISEEEREQVREATEFCRRSTSGSRSSSSQKIIKEEDLLPSKNLGPPGRKGKQKVVADMNLEAGKQVCGICLSEEAKRTVRGILNCCSHYFCFACIMEWSKVESRCPLCKQRFMTISRTARSDGSTDAVFPVPERDQVYQPSEEELQGFLNPYEHVLCTECHLGGDDALMLLCDLCDSPAHTYCVGLGHHVPDGNWYCDGCRPTALASSNAHTSSPPVAAVRETFDLNEAYVPDTPLSPPAQSPRHPIHPVWSTQAAPPASGSAAVTLFSRRRIQRQIHQLLNSRSRNLNSNEGPAATGINLFRSSIGQSVPQNVYSQGRGNANAGLLYGRGDGHQGQASSSSSVRSFVGLTQTGFPAANGREVGGLSHQHLRH